MLEAERRQKILSEINTLGFADVSTLADNLGVSSMTIRRDLKKLQESGGIIRCHGGAVSKSEVSYADKKVLNHNAKVKIAETAARFAKPGMTIYLDAGTTTYQVAKKISPMSNLTIVTNDLEIAMSLRNSNCEVIMCGGTVQKSTLSVFGCYSTMMMKDFRFDIGYFGAARINSQLQATTPTAEKGFLKRQVVTQCRATYLTVDSTKFGAECLNIVNSLADYTAVITDHQFTAREKKIIRDEIINIISV